MGTHTTRATGSLGSDNAGGRDAFVTKFNSTGNLQWSRQFGTGTDEEALAAATQNDLAPFERLLAALRRPFDAAPELAAYAEPAAAEATAGYQTFCGT